MAQRISSTGPPGALARPDWHAGGELTASALNLEQAWKEQRLRRHLRLIHGWGVVCGLNVASANDGWALFICPGYGIGPCGDEILVAQRHRFNLRDYLWTHPLEGDVADRLWIALESTEKRDASLHSDCGCGGHPETASHTADGFRVTISWTAPLLRGPAFDICSGVTPACPECPDTCGLVVASVQLPNSPYQSSGLSDSAIDNLI